MPSPKTATEIDVHVGYRLKRLRREKELSQSALGRAANVSFQQIQKYERGQNRISVGRLWDFCELLEVKPAYFFDGFEDTPRQNAASTPLAAQLS